MAKFVNLTPHVINETTTGTIIDPSGKVARVISKSEEVGRSYNNIPLYRTTYGEVEGLPEMTMGIVYIVSGMVLAAIKDRPDVVAPGELTRDVNGNPIGCHGFKTNMNNCL